MNRPTPEENENRLLVERIQLAGKIVIAGIVVQMIAEWMLHSTDRPGISAVQALNVLVVMLVLGLPRSPLQRSRYVRRQADEHNGGDQ